MRPGAYASARPAIAAADADAAESERRKVTIARSAVRERRTARRVGGRGAGGGE